MTQDEINHLFTYHAPTPDQVARMTRLREHARELAHALVELCPNSADRAAAMRKLREVVMTANAAIILEAK